MRSQYELSFHIHHIHQMISPVRGRREESKGSVERPPHARERGELLLLGKILT